jgi:hypothetical protein
MVILSVVFVIVTVLPRTRPRDRMLTAAFAIISGITAWMMASHWRWPQ